MKTLYTEHDVQDLVLTETAKHAVHQLGFHLCYVTAGVKAAAV